MQRANEEAVRFRCGALTLEGRIYAPADATRGAVVCHPHPEYGGDMHNPVVMEAVTALRQRGIATLRFNFRGVGESEGRYSGSLAEADDARAAVDCLRGRLPTATLALGGYSFGAMVALVAGAAQADVERLFAIALPATMFDLSPIRPSTRPKLFLAGDRDQYCPYPALEAAVGQIAGTNSLVCLRGADHFLAGFEERVGEEIARFCEVATPRP